MKPDMKLWGQRSRWVVFRGALVLLLLCIPYLSYAQCPYYELAAEVLERIIGKEAGKSEAKIFLGSWAAERDAAITAILEKRAYDPKVVEAVRVNLETPQKALISIEGTEIEARLFTYYSEWQNILYSLAQDEALARPVILTATQLMQTELVSLTNNPAAHQNLLRYYQEEIRAILEEVKTHPGRIEGLSDVESALQSLDRTFQASLHADTLSQGAREMMEESFTETNFKLQRGIRFLQGAVPKESYIERLKVLSQLINGYSFSLVSTHLGGIELDFLLAQVRFGTLENQKFSFHQLVRHFAKTKQRLSPEVLRELVANKNNHFREYVVSSYKKAEALPPRILRVLDRELFKTRLFFPGDKEFEESVETMVALITYSDEKMLASGLFWTTGLKTGIEKRVGMVRALGRLNSPEAFKTLLEILPNLGSPDDILFRACVEELVGVAKVQPARLSKLLDVLIPLARSEDLAIRKNAIWGLGEALSIQHNADANILIKLLREMADAATQTEIILALSKLPYNDAAAALIRPAIAKLEPQVNLVASLYFVELEPQTLGQVVRVLELPAEAVSEETKLLALGAVQKYFPGGGTTLRTSLLNLARNDSSRVVRLEALSLLAKTKDPQAAQLLLTFFEEASGSQKRRVLIELLTNFDDCPTLRQTVRKVVDFYQDSRYHFDLFDVVGQEHALSQRLAFLKNDPETLRYISSLDTSSNPGLEEFVAVVFH